MLRDRALIPTLALAAGALVLGACASSGYDQARTTVQRAESYGEQLGTLGERLELALEALDTLTRDPLDSPRTSRETYETFRREVANLDVQAKRVERAFGRMDAQAGTFFLDWRSETAAIVDADLKGTAESRRAVLEASFTTLSKGQVEVEAELATVTARMADLVLYLEHDLTRSGLASAREPIQRAFEESRAFLRLLEDQSAAVKAARSALEPLEAQAGSSVPATRRL